MICNYFSFRASHGQPRQTYAINTLAPPLFLALCVCVFVRHRLRQMLLGHWLEQEEAHIAHAERMVNEMVQDRLRVSFWWNDVLFNELRLLRIHWVCLKLSEIGDTTW